MDGEAKGVGKGGTRRRKRRCRRRLECFSLFPFFLSAKGESRKNQETPRSKRLDALGVSLQRARGAERERACLCALSLSSLSFHSQRARGERTKQVQCSSFFFSLSRKKKKKRFMRCPSALALAALAAMALCASAKSATTAPFVNWSSLREGAPRDKHAEALQLAKVKMFFCFGLRWWFALFLSCFCFDAFLLVSAPAHPASSEDRVSRQRLGRERGRWRPRRRPSGRCPWERGGRDEKRAFFFSSSPPSNNNSRPFHSPLHSLIHRTGQPPLGV